MTLLHWQHKAPHTGTSDEVEEESGMTHLSRFAPVRSQPKFKGKKNAYGGGICVVLSVVEGERTG